MKIAIMLSLVLDCCLFINRCLVTGKHYHIIESINLLNLLVQLVLVLIL